MSMSGNLLALHVEEALEDQVVLQRVHVGDAQAVEHQAGGRAASHAVQDALFACEGRDVPHHQEVVGEARLGDDLQLVGQPVVVALGRPRPATPQTFPAQARQVGVRGLSVGRLVVRQVGLVEGEVDGALLGDALSVGQGLGKVREQLRHLRGALQVEGVPMHLEPLVVVDRRVGVDADEDVLERSVLRRDVVEVVGRGQRQAKLPMDLVQAGVQRVQLGDARMALELQVEVVAEGLLRPAGVGPGLPPAGPPGPGATAHWQGTPTAPPAPVNAPAAGRGPLWAGSRSRPGGRGVTSLRRFLYPVLSLAMRVRW